MFAEKVNSFIILMAVEDGSSVVFTGNPVHYLPELKHRIKGFYDQKKN